MKGFFLFGIFLLGTPSHAGAGDGYPPKLAKCVERIERWTKVTWDFHKTTTGEDKSFLAELAQRLKGREPKGMDIELLELRDDLAALPNDQKRLAYCRKKLEDARTATALYVEDVRVSQAQGVKVPAPVRGYVDELDRTINDGATAR